MTLRIPDDKPVYVIITLGVHEDQTPSDSPEVVRANLEATGVLRVYMTNNLPLYSGNFLGVLHTPRDHVDYSCMKAWNLGQAYDDNKGLTRYLDAGVAMLMYYTPNEMYVKWMRDLAKNGDSASEYSTSGTSKRLYFLMTVEDPHYWTSDLQEVIDEALQWFDGIILYNYRSLVMRGGIERI